MREGAPSGPWPRRLGLLFGATAGLLFAFGVAWLVERLHRGSPVLVLRWGSPLCVLGGAALGARIARGIGDRGYRTLAMATGLSVAGVLALLLLALFGISK